MEPRVHIGKTAIQVEVAKDTETIRKGLSGRELLASDKGMLFVFPRLKWYRFWMREMRFPIDIIWIREGKIVNIAERVKNEFDPSRPRFYTPNEKIDSVLEVNAGFAKKKNIKAGDLVAYENIFPEFDIVFASESDKERWNEFIEKNQPIVGTFLEAWGWGDFQKHLGFNVERYFVREKGDIVAVFMLVRHRLPFGFSYGYVPRGPVIAAARIDEEAKHFEIVKAIKKWAERNLQGFVFLRLEPPMTSLSKDTGMYGFRVPSYSIQPPHNTVVSLERTEEEILSHFHPSTRSNIKRAEKRGVTFEMRQAFSEEDYQHFFSMIKSTIARNHGKNAYPSDGYLRTFLSHSRVLNAQHPHDRTKLSTGIFCGYHNGEPAAMHIVVFFGDTATYLFGASYTEHLNSKVDTYLHWSAMREAKRLGMRFYDIGGIDENIWPSLTRFKRQFGGDEIYYVGNIDVPLKPAIYRMYNILKKSLKILRGQA